MEANSSALASVLRRVCDTDEATMYLRFRSGKSLDALAQLHRRYEGPNGVQEALNDITMRVEGAMRPNAYEEPPDDDDGGIPIRHTSISTANLNRAGASGKPPISPAPAPSSVFPSHSELHANGASPSAASDRPSRRPRGQGRVEEAVLAALADGPRVRSELVEAIPHSRSAVHRVISAFAQEGRIVDSGRRKQVGGRGTPTILWSLPGGDVCAPPPVPPLSPQGERVLAHLAQHGETRQNDLWRLLGISPGAINGVMKLLLRAEKVVHRGDARALFWRLPDQEPGSELSAGIQLTREDATSLLSTVASVQQQCAHLFDRIERILRRVTPS